jgi:hypothetical protein
MVSCGKRLLDDDKWAYVEVKSGKVISCWEGLTKTITRHCIEEDGVIRMCFRCMKKNGL